MTTTDDLPSVDGSSLPPVLYVPCVEHVVEIDGLQLEYRQTSDGKVAFMAYTALDRLRDSCGVDQPWVMLPLAAVRALYTDRPWDVLLLDLHVPEEHRWGAHR
jgi:hypothetical protein